MIDNRMVIGLKQLAQSVEGQGRFPSAEETLADSGDLLAREGRISARETVGRLVGRPRQNGGRPLQEAAHPVERAIVEVGPLKVVELQAAAHPGPIGVQQHHRPGFDAEGVVRVSVSPFHRVLDPVATRRILSHELADSHQGTPGADGFANLLSGTQQPGRTGLKAPAAGMEPIHSRPAGVQVVGGGVDAADQHMRSGKYHPEVITRVEVVGRRVGPQAGLGPDGQEVFVRAAAGTVEDFAAAFDLDADQDLLVPGDVVAERA